VTLDAILAGIGAIVTAAGGVILVVREFRRRDRKASLRALDQLSDEVHALEADFLSYRRWAYDLATMLTDMGVHVPPAPPPVHTVPDKS
jgi:hypothetical protein